MCCALKYLLKLFYRVARFAFVHFFLTVIKCLYLRQLLKLTSGFSRGIFFMTVFITVMRKNNLSGSSVNSYCTLRDCIFYISSVYFCSDSQFILFLSPLNHEDVKRSHALSEKLLILSLHKAKNGQCVSNFRKNRFPSLKAKSCIFFIFHFFLINKVTAAPCFTGTLC